MSDPTDDGRDGSGRFAPGNQAAKGNQTQRRLAAFRQALLAAVTPEDIAVVARSLLEQAKGSGSDAIAAARLILAYCVGRPPEIEESSEACTVIFRRPTMVPLEEDPGDSLESASAPLPIAHAPAPRLPAAEQEPAEEQPSAGAPGRITAYDLGKHF